MDPHTHFLFPFAVGLILYKLGLISGELVLLAGVIGVLIDVDHYIEHILHAKTNRFSFRAAWNNSIKLHRFNQRSFIHYGTGAMVLTIIFIVIAWFNWRLALVLSIGYYSHLLLDLPFHFKNHLEKKAFRWKIGPYYMKESSLELVIDIILLVVIIIWLWILFG